jgi:NTP pyrophosphatase (non-canonical NTP hydrolase)
MTGVDPKGLDGDRPSKFLAWACETFSSEVAMNIAERLMRFTEEAVELAMACDMPRATLDKITERVYGREPGNIKQETAQCQVTLELLAKVLNIDLDAAADEEFQRVQSIPKEHWDRRHAAKVALGIAKGEPVAALTPLKGAPVGRDRFGVGVGEVDEADVLVRLERAHHHVYLHQAVDESVDWRWYFDLFNDCMKSISRLQPFKDELLKIAEDVGEASDPFAAWESIEAMRLSPTAVKDAAANLLASLDPDTLNLEQFNAWHALDAAMATQNDQPQTDEMQPDKYTGGDFNGVVRGKRP